MRYPTGRQAMRCLFIALSLLFYPAAAARAEVGFSIGIHLGINVPVYPRLVLVPGYPVYYAPHMNLNYFFYDGLYWVFQNDHWYVSSWYNGPWDWVGPEYVPSFVLRIPVRYYRHPPIYFHGWRVDAPPRWGERWGHDWEEYRAGWDRWDRHVTPRPAPLPIYQRRYSGSRYPAAVDKQQRLHSENYRYQPREDATQQHLQRQDRQDRPRIEPQQRVPIQQPNPQWRQPQPVQPMQQQQRQPSPTEPQDRRGQPVVPQDQMREPVPRQQPVPMQQPSRMQPLPPEQQGRGGATVPQNQRESVVPRPQPIQPLRIQPAPTEQQERGKGSTAVPQDRAREPMQRAVPMQQPPIEQQDQGRVRKPDNRDQERVKP